MCQCRILLLLFFVVRLFRGYAFHRCLLRDARLFCFVVDVSTARESIMIQKWLLLAVVYFDLFCLLWSIAVSDECICSGPCSHVFSLLVSDRRPCIQRMRALEHSKYDHSIVIQRYPRSSLESSASTVANWGSSRREGPYLPR